MNAIDDQATRFVLTRGLRFAYQHHPRQGGECGNDTIVLIRGLGTQLIEWSPLLIERLTHGGLNVLIFDNRDAGLSSQLKQDYPLADMATDVVAILDELAIDQAHVFGISLGGMVAQLVAYHHGERVKCLFSVMSTSGADGLPRPSREVARRLTANAGDRDELIEQETHNRLVFGSPDYPEPEGVRREMSIRAYERCWAPDGVARQMKAATADGSRVGRLNQIRSRTLVIHGRDDPLIPLGCGQDTARQIRGSSLQVIDGMGHNIPDALAADIGKRVLHFIAS